ncbi:hypothetical protein CerSpe_216910 [Prunus speciosa]
MEDASTLVSGWAWLPSNILDLILEKLIPISDYIRFSAVCKHWQLVALHRKKQHIKSCHKQIPMLVIPTIDGTSERRGLYSVTQGKTCSFELNVYYSKRFCGSSHGWLACVDENLVVTLLNPFTEHTVGAIFPTRIIAQDSFSFSRNSAVPQSSCVANIYRGSQRL